MDGPFPCVPSIGIYLMRGLVLPDGRSGSAAITNPTFTFTNNISTDELIRSQTTMSEQPQRDALPHELPKAIRSKLLLFETNDSIPEFTYRELPADKKRIWLLRLLPGVLQNPQIDCEMFEAEFDNQHNLVQVNNTSVNKHRSKKQKVKNKQIANSAPEPDKDHAESSTKSKSKKEMKQEKEVGANEQGAVIQNGRMEYDKESNNRRTKIEDIFQYEALSWRWGDEKNGPHIVMLKNNGLLYKKRVSETLGLALKYLRTKRDRILWIDAICINQNDHEERSSQVAMMSLVYTGAVKSAFGLGKTTLKA